LPIETGGTNEQYEKNDTGMFKRKDPHH